VTERLPKALHASVRQHCDRLGNSMMPIRPSGYCAIWRAGSTTRRLVSPPASSKDSTRF
jgi:hypothetical protein